MAKKNARSSSPKRTARAPKAQPAPKPRSSPLSYAFVAIAIVVLLALVALVAYKLMPRDGVVATVNGEPITQEWLDFQYGLLPQSYQAQLSREEALEQVINEQLIVQAAQREGIEVTDAEVNEQVQKIMTQNGLTLAQFQDNLAKMNVSSDQFEELIRRQLYISRYSEVHINVSEPTDEDLRSLYDLNKERFAVPEQVTVRHVLVSSQRADAAQLAKEIYDAVRAGADICEYAKNSSDDKGSRDTCGEYTFPKGVMVPEFERAAFSMSPSDVQLIQTEFGYHVLVKVANVAPGVRPFEEVRDALAEQYMSAAYAREYQRMISEMRANAKITYASGKSMYAPPAEAGNEASQQPEEPQTPAAPEEPNVPAAPEEPAPAQEDMRACIAGKATLYGTEWSSDAQAAKEMFSGYDLRYVACDDSPAECEGIEAFPTWSIDGKQYLGRMSLEQLATEAGC